ncbi:MAG TPA: branched-chain amino acid ABC transporter permease [Pyrinomonadaceae bacterium]|jgi:branched-chain amino acid transport system permease protein
MPTFVKRIVGALLIILLLYMVHMMMSREGLFGFGIGAYPADILMLIFVNIILAVSLNLINGFTGQFSIGHAGFMAIGAYTSAYLTVYHGQAWERQMAGSIGETAAMALVFLVAILVGALAAAVMGLIVGIPSLRLRGDYLAIVTLGFAEIIRIVILNIDVVGGATGFSVPGYSNILWVGGFAVITIIVIHNIVRSDAGRALISIREDELASEAMGINTTRYKVMAFVISSSFAGVAGVLFAHYKKFLHTNDFQFIRSFEIIIMIVLGGMGSITGSILGAIVITVLPELLRQLPTIDLFGRAVNFADLRLVIYALLLIGIMLTRPQGVLGQREFGFNWLKRAQKRPEGDEAVGASGGVPIAERDAPTADKSKEAKNQ